MTTELLRGQVGGDTQLHVHLKLYPITSPDRPGLPDFSCVRSAIPPEQKSNRVLNDIHNYLID